MTRYHVIATAAVLASVLCTEFPTRYERIEPDALRSIGFTYAPYAEAAPGDTITVRAYFGGERVTSVDWTWSTDHVVDGYGTDTVLNIRKVPIIRESSYLPDSVEISFRIPDSVFFTTRGLSARVYNATRAALPQGMRSMPQAEHAAFLADLMAIDPTNPVAALPFLDQWGSVMGIAALDSSALETVLAVGGSLLYAFSVPARIYAVATSESGKKLKIIGDFGIRYNRKLSGTDFAEMLPVNRNPDIRWIGVYTVKSKGLGMFNPNDSAFAGKYSLQYLYNEIFPDSVNDTVLVDTGCTYYFAADSGIMRYTLKAGTRIPVAIAGRDTTWDTLDADTTVNDTAIDRRLVPISQDSVVVESETWSYSWQYQNLGLDSVTEPLDSLFMVMNTGAWIAPSLPSLDPKMPHARIWVTTRDFIIDFNRPVGISIRSCDVHFRYSEAYRERRK